MPDFARFDRRNYPKVSVRDGYRDWTATYENTVEDAMDIALLERVESVPWKDMARVADLGCGTGRTGAWLASKGVGELHGVDLTPEMLAQAERRGVFTTLVEGDARSSGLESGGFDLVTCSLVDEHLSRIAPLYDEAERLLRPGGHFVLVGYHPFFMMASGMPTHFDHPQHGPVSMDTHVHLSSEHMQAGRAAGLVALELKERLVDGEWVRLKPKWARYRDWPISFAWVWRKKTDRGGSARTG